MKIIIVRIYRVSTVTGKHGKYKFHRKVMGHEKLAKSHGIL